MTRRELLKSIAATFSLPMARLQLIESAPKEFLDEPVDSVPIVYGGMAGAELFFHPFSGQGTYSWAMQGDVLGAELFFHPFSGQVQPGNELSEVGELVLPCKRFAVTSFALACSGGNNLSQDVPAMVKITSCGGVNIFAATVNKFRPLGWSSGSIGSEMIIPSDGARILANAREPVTVHGYLSGVVYR